MRLEQVHPHVDRLTMPAAAPLEAPWLSPEQWQDVEKYLDSLLGPTGRRSTVEVGRLAMLATAAGILERRRAKSIRDNEQIRDRLVEELVAVRRRGSFGLSQNVPHVVSAAIAVRLLWPDVDLAAWLRTQVAAAGGTWRATAHDAVFGPLAAEQVLAPRTTGSRNQPAPPAADTPPRDLPEASLAALERLASGAAAPGPPAAWTPALFAAWAAKPYGAGDPLLMVSTAARMKMLCLPSFPAFAYGSSVLVKGGREVMAGASA